MTKRPRPEYRPIVPASNLTASLADMLARQIEEGELAPGERLPTEQSLVASTQVSRTVVREALATLRARGLITTQQGAGAFVAERRGQRHFTIRPGNESLSETLHVLELRIGIEVEAVGLAAVRRSDDDLAELRTRLENVSAAKGEAAIGAEEDFAFHRTILTATGNPYFARVYDVFGTVLIPRQRNRLGEMTSAALEEYLARLRGEHQEIVVAIERSDARAAQRAVRQHLTRSLTLYRKLLEKME